MTTLISLGLLVRANSNPQAQEASSDKRTSSSFSFTAKVQAGYSAVAQYFKDFIATIGNDEYQNSDISVAMHEIISA
jgi:hypothetical protein